MDDSRQTDFFKNIEVCVKWYQAQACKEIIIIHHNDADGLSSGAILQQTFYRDAKKVRRISLEKPYPEALSLIISSLDNHSETLLVLADFASGMIPIIEGLLPKDLRVLILDHHQLSTVSSKNVYILNPLQLGISGQKECSASTLCYLFSHSLNNWNEDLAWIALAGIMGDSQYKENFQVTGLNQIPLEHAKNNQSIIIAEQILYKNKQQYPLKQIVDALNALGSVGYFEGGTDIGVKGLVDGWGPEVENRGDLFIQRFKELVDKIIATITLNIDGNLAWFQLSDDYQKVGVKTVGLICEELIKRKIVSGESYVLGIQPIASNIPGVGSLTKVENKISMRVTLEMQAIIESGKKLPLTEILPLATKAVAGFVDACHPYAAATTIPKSGTDVLIGNVKSLIAG
jgi:single-stranded-DNA-specific exonuclease